MKINIITTILTLCSLSPIYAQTNKNNIDMGCDSTCLNPGVMGAVDLSKNISSTRNKPVNASCAAYAGSYGIPPGATQGNVILFYEDSPTNPRYGQVVLADYSGCSIPSQPITVTRQCSAYVGSYGIASGSQGTFNITTEGNPYKSNYGSVLSTDTSGCYVPPPVPPQPPGCYGSVINTWYKNGKKCSGSPPNFTAPGEFTAANSYPGYLSSSLFPDSSVTGRGTLWYRCDLIVGLDNRYNLRMIQDAVNSGADPGDKAPTCN